MREVFIETRNFINFLESIGRLEKLPMTAPRIGLVYGSFGLGKTYPLERIAAKKNAILLRAVQTWNKKQLLEKLCTELALDISGVSGRMYEMVVEELIREPRILIIDEVDTLLRRDKVGVFEMLRDIHDETPIVLYYIGMEESHAKLKRHRHYYSRITEVVEFKAICLDDIKKFCGLCDVVIESDVMEYLEKKYPNLRQIKVLLLRIENKCKINEIERVDLPTFKLLEVEYVKG